MTAAAAAMIHTGTMRHNGSPLPLAPFQWGDSSASTGVFCWAISCSRRSRSASDPVFANLLSLKTAPQPTAAAPSAPAPVVPRLAGFLAPEIAQGLVSVVDSADRSVVTLRGDGVFASGSGDVSRAYLGLLGRIGDALKTVPGKVVVIGHTDNTQPGLSARFPSNYELSKARATAVRDLLAERAGPETRYSVEGRGDSEPLATNDTPAGRSRNRRVEIVLITPATAN